MNPLIYSSCPAGVISAALCFSMEDLGLIAGIRPVGVIPRQRSKTKMGRIIVTGKFSSLIRAKQPQKEYS